MMGMTGKQLKKMLEKMGMKTEKVAVITVEFVDNKDKVRTINEVEAEIVSLKTEKYLKIPLED